MEFIITKHTPGIRPDVKVPSTDLLKLLLEDGIRKMVSDHYDLLSESSIKDLFPKNPIALGKAKEHSADFFIQICGGSMYFNKNRGKPMLYKRHSPHKITSEAREVWLNCYKTVLKKLKLPDEVIQSFWNYLDIFQFGW